MIEHIIQQWEGYNFYANLSEKEFYGFRETGYAGNMTKALDRAYPDLHKQYDIVLYFMLSHDKPVWNIHHFTKPVILIVAAHEHPVLPAEVVEKAHIIFKQYVDLEETRKHKHLFRIPVGPSSIFPEVPVVPMSERKHNVFFAGNLHRGRQQLYEELTGIRFLPFPILHRLRSLLGTDFSKLFPESTITFSTQFHAGFAALNYAEYLAQSKIMLCPYGVTETETMRHFEAMKQGCVIVSDRMPDTIYFKDAPFIIIDGWKGAKKQIAKLLADDALLQQKHLETLAWWDNYCSIEAVVKYMAGRINLSDHKAGF